ncbi:Sel1-like repeat-containing protein kinase family protein, partial [Capnocytophaga canis]|uniref:Sel1-like repeat-containing protein kinase family protein n=1 Tax=Capnocytophaga canis TaxID=1848903 RepID=UPI0019D57243
MNVNINNHTFEYHSDFDPFNKSNNGWKKQNVDAYKFQSFGATKVFIKRMESPSKYISGFGFLQKVKGKKFHSLPMIYDLVETRENDKTVYYLFQEAISGRTLEEVMKHDVLKLNIQRFLRDIYEGFEAIRQQGYWFSDFVEKNIFVGDEGGYYLIDLDSVVSLDILPMADHHFLGTINRNYKNAIASFWYKDTFGYSFPLVRDYLKGDTINVLELLIFMGQLRYFMDHLKSSDFLAAETRKQVPKYLLQLDESKTKNCFISAFSFEGLHQKPLEYGVLENYIKTVLFPTQEIISVDFNKKSITNKPIEPPIPIPPIPIPPIPIPPPPVPPVPPTPPKKRKYKGWLVAAVSLILVYVFGNKIYEWTYDTEALYEQTVSHSSKNEHEKAYDTEALYEQTVSHSSKNEHEKAYDTEELYEQTVSHSSKNEHEKAYDTEELYEQTVSHSSKNEHEKAYDAEALYKQALSHSHKNEHEKAFELFLESANKGHSEAQYDLGEAYYSGIGISKDYNEAVKWYRKAAEQGHSRAQYSLGDMYNDGYGVSKDYYEAVKWFRKAAEQGYEAGQLRLGLMYYYGNNVPKDYNEAVKWFRKAAEQGSEYGQNKLGDMYYYGDGVPKDYNEAVKWYRKAAEQGNAFGQNDLGDMYYYGYGVSKDYNEAVKWYRKSAEQGNALGQYNLGVMYDYGYGVPKDEAEAVKW